MLKKLLIFMLILLLILSGCIPSKKDKFTYVFWNPDSQVASIEILKKAKETGSENDPTDVVLVLTKDEFNAFLEELTALPGEHQSLDPLTGLGPYIIRITYENGVVALIGYANTIYQYPDGNRKYYYFCFSYDSFQNLINQTLANG